MIFNLVLLAATASATPSHASVQRAATCRTIQVQSGDSCGALAQRCGLSAHDFTTYNPDPHLCSALRPQQYVCCSAGSLPDLRPKPNPNGSCASYTSRPGDDCAAIGAARGLTAADIESMNHQTWGWDGCIHLQAQQTFCLSTGTPPMPAPVKGTICGPQVPGTQPPADMSKLAHLNPCPLNACCNKWGQCGTTSDFCIPSNSSTGNPGTSAPGKNGCISNCGMDIVDNASAPSVFHRVGYFEAWNMERECLNMDASQIDATQYDVVHFSFAGITPDFKVNISSVKDQFDTFKKQSGFKKVVSFGGWSFSTSLDSFPIFRSAVAAGNRATFAQNVADFIHANGLDGVDFDWEYPGAPDIPGIPPGDPGDGGRYLSFLQALRSKLDQGKTLSIAAPASYWYLRGFPIAEISKVVDYIVYMTYDLHGQWDYGNTFAAEGCPAGSCLRSHVNYTETINALAMITKAGVPAAKIVVGVGSYGRSFKMSKPGCQGPLCTFTGPKSGARPGICTNTAGYISNAEIEDIIAKDSTAKKNYDQGSDSIILEYGGDNWIAYMDDNTRKSRTSSYTAKHFGGTVEWAMDLRSFHPPLPDKTGAMSQGGHGPDLTSQSSCQDLENFQSPDGLTSDMWDFADTSTFLSNWVKQKWLPSQKQNFMSDFATPWGLGQSTASCGVISLCQTPDCGIMGNQVTSPGSGPAYMVIVAFYNVMRVLENIYTAIGHARDEWNSLPDWFQSNFNEDAGAMNALPLQEAILGIGTAVGVITALAGNPVAGAIGALIQGIAGGIVQSIPNPTDNSVQALGDFQKFMHDTLDITQTSVSSFFTDFQTKGNSHGVDLQQIFQGGKWADWRNIPIVNPGKIDTNTVNDIFSKHVSAAAINWAWHTQRVWLMSYPMTEAEFNLRVAYAGNNEIRLKHYYKGRGYFFMSIFPQSQPLSPFLVPRIQNPPGWGNVGDVEINTHQIIESSADGFAIGGFSYNPVNDIASTLESNTRNLLTDSVSLPGVFNIPICALDSTYGWTPTLDAFFNSMAGPGALHDRNDFGTQSPLCYCLGLKDAQGKVFDSQIDVANWHGGNNPQCPPGYNTRGGPPQPTVSSARPPPPTHGPKPKDEL